MSKPTLVIGTKALSSWSLRPWLALRLAHVEFDEVVIPLNEKSTKGLIKKYSPTAKVPVLLVDGMALWESLAICEYVAETWAKDLWPTDPLIRAYARSISHEMHAGFAALRKACPMDLRRQPSGETINPEAGADLHRILTLIADTRERFGTGGPYLFGKKPTIADCMYAPVVTRITSYGLPLTSQTKDYVDAIWALPEMQRFKAEALAEQRPSDGQEGR